MRDINRYEQDYLDNPFESEMVTYRHRKSLETISESKPAHILEVGCGLVPLYEYWQAFEQLVIFEPSAYFSGRASQSAPDNVKVINEELTERHTAGYEAHFDLIVISSLLHELEDPLKLLQCAGRLGRQHSTIHINVPNANSLHRLLALKMGLIESLTEPSARQVKYQQHHTFDVESLKALVRAANMEVVSAETFFIKPFTHKQMQDMVNAGLLSQDMIEGLYRLSNEMPGMGAEIVLNARV